MITKNSRYYGGSIHVLVNKTSVVRRVFPYRTVSFKYHTWTSSDRLDLLAYFYYADASLWPMIMDYNPQILNPSRIKVGDQIRIPIPESGDTEESGDTNG